MIWPSSTPSQFNLPRVDDDESLASDENRDDKVIGFAINRSVFAAVVVTWRGVYIFRPKPWCPVASFIRSKKSVQEHGDNESVMVRTDGQLIAVTTSQGSVLTFTVSTAVSGNEICQFVNESGQGQINAYPGPGENDGVRQLRLRFRTTIRARSQISQALILDESLLVITKDPQSLQLMKWSEGNVDTVPLHETEWLPDTEFVTDLVYSRAMSLFACITYNGRAYTATLDETSGQFKGHNIHEPEGSNKLDDRAVGIAINARFSVVAVGCTRGRIYLYTVRDYQGSVYKIREVNAPASSTGRILVMKWNRDGYGLFVGYENGWAIFSVYGMLTCSSFLSKQEQKLNEGWLDGIKVAAWSSSGSEVFVVPNNGQLWSINVLKWGACGNFSNGNLQRPILYTDTKLMVYRGHEQSDITTIDRDALQWLQITIPATYIAEHWAVRHVAASVDGRYIAISGKHGLTHYSLVSGRWKMFSEDYMDREFTVRGMVWYKHLLITALDTDQNIHEVRFYNRDLVLEPKNVVSTIELPTSVIKISMNGDLLLVYTQDNTLSFFRVSYDEQLDKAVVDLENAIAFESVVQSPQRVRSIRCFSNDQNEIDSSTSPLLVLVDGQLVLLRPHVVEGGDVEYSKRVLHQNIEYFTVTSPNEYDSKRALWAFDGQDMLVWLQDLYSNDLHQQEAPPCAIPVEAYPLALLLNKGIIMGIESDMVLPREAPFTYFKPFTSTQLFLPHLLESYLRVNDESRALAVAKESLHLKYFAHILEMLLYRLVEFDDDNETLTRAINLLRQFPNQMLDVIVGCTRKTEVSYWKRLFNAAGSPHEMFEKCIELGKLRTAGGYLLVLHNLVNSYEDTTQDTETVMRLAHETGDWNLCKDLARFLMAVDQSGQTLRKVLDAVNIRI